MQKTNFAVLRWRDANAFLACQFLASERSAAATGLRSPAGFPTLAGGASIYRACGGEIRDCEEGAAKDLPQTSQRAAKRLRTTEREE